MKHRQCTPPCLWLPKTTISMIFLKKTFTCWFCKNSSIMHVSWSMHVDICKTATRITDCLAINWINHFYKRYFVFFWLCNWYMSTIRNITIIRQQMKFFSVPNRKNNIFERDWWKLKQEASTTQYIGPLYNNIDASFQNLFDYMNNIIVKHGPFKKISRYKLKFETSPWITTALKKSVSIKNKFFKRVKKKDVSQKNELHKNHKICRKVISTLMKRGKQNYFSKYFESNLTNIKNTWNSIKGIKHHGWETLHWLLQFYLLFKMKQENPKTIANIFKIYFSIIDKKNWAKKIYKITLNTSQMKTLIPFSSHQQTKKKLILSSLVISKNNIQY